MSRDASYFVVTSGVPNAGECVKQGSMFNAGRGQREGEQTRSLENKILKDYQSLNGISDRNQGREGEKGKRDIKKHGSDQIGQNSWSMTQTQNGKLCIKRKGFK